MPDAPRVSVVVPVRNAARGISGLLEALAAQTLGADAYEAIVVDDASTDETAAAAERAPGVVVLRTQRRGGSYAARNLGLARARGEVLAFTDSDCVPARDWLERGLEDLERLSADLLAGKVEVPPSGQPTLAEFVDARFLDQEGMVRGGDAATANLFVRRRVFDRLGPFEERLMAGGDTEFTRRAGAAGHRLEYSAGARVVHPPRRRARDVARKTFRMGVGRTQLARYAAPGTWDLRPLWTYPGAWVPGTFLRLPGSAGGPAGVDRLEARGYRLSRGELRRLELAEWALVQLPMVLGGLVESARGMRRR